MDSRQLDRQLGDIKSRIHTLNQEVYQLRQFQAGVEYEKQLQAVLDLTGRLQTNAVAYTNLVIVAGYAAFFTFWGNLENNLPQWLHALSGLFILLSLLLFLAWEVTKMIWSAFHLRQLERQFHNRPPEPNLISHFQQAVGTFERRINRLWIWFLVPTVVFGLAGGCCLISFFVRQLYNTLV